MSATSQVRQIDATYILDADHGHHLDPLDFWVFETGTGLPPTIAEIDEHFRRRAPLFAELNRRFVAVPAHLDHGYWVTDDRPLEQRILHDDRIGLDWNGLLDALSELTSIGLDARATAWRIDVFHQVRDVPGSTSSVTVVVLRGNHSLISGPILQPLIENLFGEGTESVPFPGVPPAAPRVDRLRAAAKGLTRAPGATARYVRAVRAAMREAARGRAGESAPSAAPADLTVTRLDRDPGDRRSLIVLRLPRTGPLPRPVTVTALMLTAMSVALERYLTDTDGRCPSDLTSFVTLALGDAPEHLGINRISWTDVALHPDIVSIPERCAAVQATLTERRGTATATGLQILENFGTIPSFVLPFELAANRRRVRARTAPRMHTVLTSIRLGDTTAISLAGRPLLFAAGCPPLTAEATLVHGLFGHGDDLTLSILTSPDVMPDHRRYAALLEAAFTESVEALQKQA